MKQSFFFFCLFASVISGCNTSQEENKDTQPKASGTCQYARDENDAVGKHIRVVRDEKFIALDVDSVAKAAFKGDDFFKGYLSCVSVDTTLGIYFDFKIQSADAYQYYGSIKKDNKITFVLASGKAIELPFGEAYSGSTNLSAETTVYSSYAPLSRDVSKQLTSEVLQHVRISWSKKEEEYRVVNPNVLINQLPCVQ